MASGSKSAKYPVKIEERLSQLGSTNPAMDTVSPVMYWLLPAAV